MTPSPAQPSVRASLFASRALCRARSEQERANAGRGLGWARLGVALATLALAGCTASAQPAPGESPTSPYATAGAPSTASPGTASPDPGNTLSLNITISKGQVSPNGEKIDVRRGETVVLNVLSDQDDEVHAHTGGDGHEFEVQAGQPFRGQFTVPDPGSFEVESHHLSKIIVILNVR